MNDNGIRANRVVVPNHDPAEHGGASADDHTVSDRGVPMEWICSIAKAFAQGDPVENRAVVTHH